MENEQKKRKITVWCVVRRVLLCLFTLIVLAAASLYLLLLTVAKGPSETVRNMLVLSAKQASATKWIPSLFLDDGTVESIVKGSEEVEVDVMTAAEYAKLHEQHADREQTSQDGGKTRDEWEDSAHGVALFTDSGDTYKAYIMLVRDPSRVFVGTSTDDYEKAEVGMNVFGVAARYGAYAAINGGEFSDPGGEGTGDKPIGLTYSRGKCVWDDGAYRTFIGFNYSNRLIVSEGMTKERAESLGIRDAVMFQNGNTLISSWGDNVNLYYSGGNTGTAQRCAIGQREDGTVIFIVTDGRSAASLGATHNDMIDMMVKYGAVNAAMLDGGSSAMMYCENYYNDFPEFSDVRLDQYQERGLVNKYKAFTSPRPIPTYFVVAKEAGG